MNILPSATEIKLLANEKRASHPRLFLFNLPEGITTKERKRIAVDVLASEVLALEPAAFEQAKESLVWSRTAGCSCGCSPGFILRGFNLGGNSIYVEVTS